MLILKRVLVVTIMICFMSIQAWAAYIIVPMSETNQKDHLKAYGVAYWVIEKGVDTYWLLNYDGGAFAFQLNPSFEAECKARNVSYKVITDGEFLQIRERISNPEVNQEVVKLEQAPKIAVYTPEFNSKGEKLQPWDDAVTLVLTYAEIPYDVIYDREIMEDKLAEYDWLHLHHEDFTGQYGKFYKGYSGQAWYKTNQKNMEKLANGLGFQKVSELKKSVVQKIREFVAGGGFMFAMCSATDTYDIVLATEGQDICHHVYDGDPADETAGENMDFSQTFAFKDFTLIKNHLEYEYSTIDNRKRKIDPKSDYFTLFEFSAKWDIVPAMLCQNHTTTVKGFMGQTTAYHKDLVKSEVLIMGETKSIDEARYIHGEYGMGQWTFYGGHDPEDYQHFVNDPETDLSLHPNSPGYRLILNNVLFPAAKKKKWKT